MIKIFAKPPILNISGDIAISRRDNAHVNSNGFCAAHPLKLPLLQKAEQLGLNLRQDIAELIEKDRSTMRQLHLTFFQLVRARKGPFFVAEQFALQKFF